MTDKQSGQGAGEHDPVAQEESVPLVPKVFSLPTDLDYRLRMAAARQRTPKVKIVRQALVEHLAHDPERGPREAVFLPPELVERLSEAAKRRQVTLERLVTDLLAETLGGAAAADE